MTILNDKLVGAYLHGSIAFPGFRPQSGDIDFYTVVKQPLTKSEIEKLDQLHGSLARAQPYGKQLDGFYIPLTKTRRESDPGGLVYAANGKVDQGGSDDAWAIHREHFQHASYIALAGPKANQIFSRPTWPRLREELYAQLRAARMIIDEHPGYSVLSLCRLVYNFRRGNIAVSKMRAAQWGVRNLPPEWRPIIRSAIREYEGQGTSRDRHLLKRKARAFLGFASLQMIAFDPTENPRSPAVKYLTKSMSRKREER